MLSLFTATKEASDNCGSLPSAISKNDLELLECFVPDAATLDLCQAANGIQPPILSTIAPLTEDPRITQNTLKSNYTLAEATSNSGPSTLGTSVLPKSLVALSTKHNSTLTEIAIQADPKEHNEPNEAHSFDKKTLAPSSKVFLHIPTGPTSICANSTSNASIFSTVAPLTEDPRITQNTLQSKHRLTETTSNSGPSTLGTSVLPNP
ncbi:hypothetical protein PPACK8108_LOCUS19844 [Phakopsora pachyrhizi]|uniref:Uncharacterized protein n=1 Tax=Phakopsora pachyrhizi TaxID=170000 RepID=A0AAV0BG25_PHAPC|nr:hypothetical protein PPACK8108_LOCUS19844 [Phakopsora pachyrhizi]